MIGIRLLSVLQISNIWQASHVATGKCIASLTASCQLPDRASYGSCNCRSDIWLMTNLFTLSPCLVSAFCLLPCVTFSSFSHFHCQEKPLRLQNILNLSQSLKEKCDIDRTMDWLYGKWVKISVCSTSIRAFSFLCSSIDVPALWSFHGIVLADWLIDPPDTLCACVSKESFSN